MKLLNKEELEIIQNHIEEEHFDYAMEKCNYDIKNKDFKKLIYKFKTIEKEIRNFINESENIIENDTKYYTSNEILNMYHGKTANIKEGILLVALSNMQQYNGRSKTMCIAMAMGYENDEGGDNTYYKVEE